MRNGRWALLALILTAGCQKGEKDTTPKIAPKNAAKLHASAADFIGMRYGNGIPADSSIGTVMFAGGKNKAGQEYGLVIWTGCGSGAKLDDCHQTFEVGTLDSQVTTDNIRLIVDAKSAPRPGLAPSLCQDKQAVHEILAWQDVSDRSNKKVVSAWRVQDSALRLEAFPPDSVLCNVNEDEGEGEEEDTEALDTIPLERDSL